MKQMIQIPTLLVLCLFVLCGCTSVQSTQPASDSAQAAENRLVIGDTLPQDLPMESSVEMISKVKNKADAIVLFTFALEEKVESVWLCRKAGDTSEFVVVDEMDVHESRIIPDGAWYSDADNGEMYTYKIVYRTTEGSFVESNDITICRLDRPAVVAEEEISQLIWEENPQADGYQVQYATQSDFSDAVVYTVKDCKHTSAFMNRLESDQKYWFRVRSYKIVDEETYYSSWSRAWNVELS